MRVVIVVALLSLGTTASAESTEGDVRVQLEQTERASFRLARLVSTHLANARAWGQRRQARCLDTLLSEVHAVGLQARARRQSRIEDERLAMMQRTLDARLERLRLDSRRCLGHERTRTRTTVTVEIEPGTPTGDPTRLPSK